MNRFTQLSGHHLWPPISTPLLIVLVMLVSSCTPGGDKKETESAQQEEQSLEVEIITNALEIQMPDSLPSGWTTFKYLNNSQMTHLIVFERYPEFEGRQLTVEDAKEVIVPAFQAVMDSLNSGGEPPFDQLPPWFENVEFLGGVGLVGPQKTAVTTINLQPGTYVVECYVKNPGGIFHSGAGMITALTVTGENNGLSEPTADVKINISSQRGIELQAPVKSGNQVFAVHFEDQALQEHFLGIDVNLVRLETGTDLEALQNWMNWMLPQGLQIPAPAEFLGGAQDMPAGSTEYFSANLQTGRYALISEVPDPKSKGMYVEFEVSN